MATASDRANLVAHLRKNRTSSPQAEDYATATSQSFDADRDAIHSTAQIHDYTTQQNLPQQQYPQYMDDMSENGSEGSADMSIELGRGVKRDGRNQDDSISSNIVFQMGDGNSLYELTATAPFMSRNTSARKTDDGLRRQASIRRATETAKTAPAAKRSTSLKQNTLTDALNKINAGDETSFIDEQPTATFNARNTRFSRSRQTSLHEQARAGSAQQTPRRGANNATAQSNSFVLPDLPNLTELVSGVRKDGTPVISRSTKSRSRFTSGSHNQARPEYNPVENVPVPNDEKAIYSSLQVLQARLAQIEDEKEDAEKRAEEYEGEIIDLRTKLAMSQGRPDSGFGSDEERTGHQTTKLRASIKSLQERLNRSERKLTNSEITCKRITNERDQLLQQIGVAYYNIEDLKQGNEDAQSNVSKLQTENDGLKDEVDELRKEIRGLRLLAQQTQTSYDEDSLQRDKREADLKRKLEKRTQMAREIKDTTRELWEVQEQNGRKQSGAAKQDRRRASQVAEPEPIREEQNYGDLESRVADAVAKARRNAREAQKTESAQRSRGNGREQSATRTRSKSAVRSDTQGLERRTSAIHTRTASAPQQVDMSDAESTTQLDFTRQAQPTVSKRASLPSPVKAKPLAAADEDTRDLTLLTWTDPQEFINLRKKLEEERRAERSKRTASAPAQQGSTSQPAAMARKSSLRDVSAGLGFEEDTGRFSIASGTGLKGVTKSVRVQSPHTSDESVQPHQPQQSEATDASFMSNTSRRRRRAASAEGMTSAFILPDITLQANKLPTTIGYGNVAHEAKTCTACPAGKDSTIPVPVPVTDREIDVDITSATIRPAEQPADALARVIKENEDEIRHLKLMLSSYERQYHQHDPALSKRRRYQVRAHMDDLHTKIDKLSDQVYRLYDVLEGQKQAAEAAAKGNTGGPAVMSEQEVDETLESVGIDPAQLSGRVGRQAPFGFDGADDEYSGHELPGFSDGESVGGDYDERRRSGIF